MAANPLKRRHSTVLDPFYERSEICTSKPSVFRLTLTENILLSHDLRKRLSKWTDIWIEENTKMAEKGAKNARDLRRLEKSRINQTYILMQAGETAAWNIKDLDQWMETVTEISSFFEIIQGSDAAAKLLLLTDECLDNEQSAGHRHEHILDLAEQLSEPKKICERLVVPPQPRSHTIPRRTLSSALFQKVKTYCRLIDLNGGTRPKYTSEMYVKKAIVELRKAAMSKNPQYGPKNRA